MQYNFCSKSKNPFLSSSNPSTLRRIKIMLRRREPFFHFPANRLVLRFASVFGSGGNWVTNQLSFLPLIGGEKVEGKKGVLIGKFLQLSHIATPLSDDWNGEIRWRDCTEGGNYCLLILSSVGTSAELFKITPTFTTFQIIAKVMTKFYSLNFQISLPFKDS